jgi:hypothetical protein
MRGKDEAGGMKDEVSGLRHARRCSFGVRDFSIGILFSAFILLPSSLALAIGSQDDVLRGISEGVGQEVDGTKVLAVLALMAGVILVIALINQSRQRVVRPRTLNHPGKLLKEVSKTVNLKPAELRQLKTLAEAQELSSPLLLLLCPSVLSKALKTRPDRVDAKVLGNLTKRMKTQR